MRQIDSFSFERALSLIFTLPNAAMLIIIFQWLIVGIFLYCTFKGFKSALKDSNDPIYVLMFMLIPFFGFLPIFIMTVVFLSKD